MRRPHHVRSTARRLAACAVLAVACAATLTGAPAQAHTDLVSTDPRPGQQLTQAPSEIRLSFNESMDTRLSTVSLTVDDTLLGPLPLRRGDEAGSLVAAVDDAAATAATSGGRSEWSISFRVTSVDGHPVTGATSFVVAAPTPAPTTPQPTPSSAPSSTSPADGATPSATTSPTAPTAGADSSRPPADGQSATWGGYLVAGGVLLLVVLGAVAASRLGRTSAEGDS